MASPRSRRTRGPSRRPAREHRPGSGIPIVFLLGVAAALVLQWFVASDVAVYNDGFAEHWFTQDDAYISYRYARNFNDGNGLVFNVGERVEGYTNFLWVIYLALAGKLGFAFDGAAKVLGYVSAMGLVILTGLLVRAVWKAMNLSFGEIAGVIGAGLVAANGTVGYWAVSGLETAFFAFLVTLALYLWLRESPATAPVLALATMTRPEGGLVWILLILAEWLIAKNGRRALQLYLVTGVLLVPFGVFKLVYYGSLLPNPFYAKTGFAWEYFASGFEYVWLYFQHYGLYGAVPLLILVAARLMPGRWRVIPLLWIIYTVYIIAVGGDVLRPHRFFVPLTAMYVISLLVAIGWLVGKLRAEAARVFIPVGAAAVVGLTGFYAPRELITVSRQLEFGLLNKMTFLAQSLSGIDPGPFTIAASTIGAISYNLPGRRVIDMLGLTDTTIARHPEVIPGNTSTWRERNFNAGYLLSQEPDYILFSTGHKPSAPAERALLLHEKYRRNYYTILFPTRERNFAVHRRRGDYTGEDAVWPSIELAHDINRAFNLQREDAFDEAVAALLRVKHEGPGDFALPDAFIANTYIQKGDLDAARAYADSALALDSLSIMAWQARGNIAQATLDTAAYNQARAYMHKICPWASFGTAW